MFEFYKKRRFAKLEKMYNEEIRDKCEKHRKEFIDCLKRLNISECNYNKNNFQDCIIKFDKDFKFKHDIK
jgi:hypothetical protein